MNLAFLSEGELVPDGLEYTQIVEKHDFNLDESASASTSIPAAAAPVDESDDTQSLHSQAGEAESTDLLPAGDVTPLVSDFPA